MKRTFTLILAAMLILTSCGSDTPDAPETTTAPIDTTTVTEAVSESIAPELPELDMKGEKFTIMTHGWGNYQPLNITDIIAEEINGESMNDAIYERMAAVNEKYNVNIEVADYQEHNNGVTALMNSISAGDDTYQLAIIRSYNYGSLLSSGMLTDLDTVPHLNLDAPYHIQSSRDALSIGGKSYGIVSDLSVHTYYTIFCTYFNKQLMADYNQGNVYDIIRDGDWTLDKMLEIGSVMAADLDNNGTYNVNDAYAFSYINDVFEGFIGAGGIKYAELDKNGTLVPMYEQESAIDAFMNLFDDLADKTTSFNVHARAANTKIGNVNSEVGMFMNRQVMFSLAGIYYAPQYRDMKDDFGIIPMPKLDASQDEYLSPMFSSVIPITVVPASNAQLEETGIIFEEMAYLGKRDLYPALFDTLLKGKIARDDDSVEMLDLIFSSTTYDAGAIFNFGKLRDSMRNMYNNGSNGFASFFESVRTQVQSEIDALMKTIK